MVCVCYRQSDLDFLHIPCRLVIIDVLTTSDDSLGAVYDTSALHLMGILQVSEMGDP